MQDAVSSKSIFDCISEMQELANSHPDWYADYEDAQADIGCDRDVLSQLLETAPTPFASGVVFGKILLRQQVASVTGRPF
jgi:hypothetical protein